MTAGDRFLGDAACLPTVTTARLRLRWITPGDVPALFGIFGDPRVCRYWSRVALPDVDAAVALQREIHALFAERTLFQWGIVERATNDFVGTCTLADLSSEHGRAEVGFALRRDRWGHGYAGEALAAAIEFAFTELELRRLEADTDPRNAASVRVLERAGFLLEGLQRERHLLAGEAQDARLFGLLRRDWELAHLSPTES